MTNSLKAEHYLTSGLNKMPTSVGTIQDCVGHAFDPTLGEGPVSQLKPSTTQHQSAKTHKAEIASNGSGLESQGDWE